MTSGVGWSVRWAPLGSDNATELLRAGWTPFAVFYVPDGEKRAAGAYLAMRFVHFPAADS
jgi:hypothetical protein